MTKHFKTEASLESLGEAKQTYFKKYENNERWSLEGKRKKMLYYL